MFKIKKVRSSVIRAQQRLRCLNAKWGVLIAYPNPIPVSGRSSVGQAMLKWYGSAAHVELRVDAPGGQLLASGGLRGEILTGPWISDGMTFYLQDVSQGKPNHEITLAKLTIYLKHQIEISWQPNHEEIVSNIVRKRTGESVLLVQTLPTFRGLVCRVFLPDRRIYFKASPEVSPIAIEAHALQSVKKMGVPVPNVLEIDLSSKDLAGAYIMLEEILGLPSDNSLVPPTSLKQALNEAGRCLRLIHSISVEGYGELQFQDGLVVGEHQSWRETIENLCHVESHMF